MRKKLSIILVLALVLATLAACTVNAPTPAPAPATPGTDGGGGGEAAAPAGDQVVSFLTWRGEDTTVFNSLIAMFEDQNPGIKINLEITPADITEYYTVLKTRITSGEGADVYQAHPGPYIAEYANAGYCLDLDTTSIPAQYEEAFLEIGQVNGVQVGVLQAYNSLGIYYNKAIFDELGIAKPVSYADMKAACDAVSAAGYLTVAAGFAEAWTTGMVYEALVGNYSPNDVMTIDNLERGLIQITEDPWLAVFTDIDTMQRDGIWQKDAVGTGYDASISLFATGQAAMLLSGTWSIGGILEMDPGFEFDIFPLPGVNAPAYAPILPGQLTAINPNAKNLDAAIKWLEFLSSVEGASYYSTNTAQSATVRGVVSDAPEIVMVQALMSGNTVDWPDTFMNNVETLTIMDEAASRILKGEAVDKVLADAQARFDAEIVSGLQ